MHKLIFPSLISFVCYSNVYSNFNFLLKGNGFQYFNNKMIYLKYTDLKDGINDIRIDSVAIQNGSFTFKGIINNPACIAELSIKKVNQFYFFVLDSGEMHVRPTSNIRLAKLIIPNSKTNNLLNDMNRMNSSLILNGKPINGMTIRDIKLKELSILREHPNNFYSLIALTRLERLVMSVRHEEIRGVFNTFNDSVKSSELGKYLGIRVNNFFGLQLGQLLPSFELKNLNNLIQSSGDILKEKIYLIAIGATWCGPCQKGIPALVKLQGKFDSSRFQIVYINLDNVHSNWLRMIKKQGMESFINLTDTVTSVRFSPMKTKFSISVIPFYLVIDKNKIICYNSYLVNDYDDSIRDDVIGELVTSFEK